MAKSRKTGVAIVIFTVIVLAVAAVLVWGTRAMKTVVLQPDAFDGPLDNPLSGFAPRADGSDIVGENKLVYLDVTWRELEPEQGRYDFAKIEDSNHLDEWRVQGKHVVFRFVCDVPRPEKHMDIPDWLYENTNADGDWYDTEYGQGYSPNYSNPVMIEAHRKAIEALGRRYGHDEFFSFIELGSLGHWGEWHTKHESGIAPLPIEDVRDQYIQPYLGSFPNSMILMRRPFKAAGQFGLGLFNDMTGEPDSTSEWMQWILLGGEYGETGEAGGLVPMPDQWKTAPIGGEFTSDISMKVLLKDELDRTLSLIRQSHVTFLGPMCPVLPEDQQFAEGIDAVRAALGSRLRISTVTMSQPLLMGGDLTVRLYWVNDGSAPFYRDWDVMLYLLDEQGKETYRKVVDIDLPAIVDKTSVSSETVIPDGELPAGTYTLALAILDPATGYPAYNFAMSGMRPDRLCIIGQWKEQ